MKFKEFIIRFFVTTKEYINYAEAAKTLGNTEMSGIEKKKYVDDKMINYANLILEKAQINFVLKYIIKNFIIKNIPTLTQAIFDLIKSKIDGITEGTK